MDYYTVTDKLGKKIELAKQSNQEYRTTGKSKLSDPEYDVLIEEIVQLQDKLKSLSPGHELLDFNPHQIGYKVDGDRKSKLPIVMASMEKLKSFEDILDWIRLKEIPAGTKFVLTPKYDGLSLCVDEETNEAWTRGDGVEGQKSDAHFEKMGEFYPKPVPIYSFGEAIIKKRLFEERYSFAVAGEVDGYANPRNMVSGKLNDKNPSIALSDFDYIRYGMEYKTERPIFQKPSSLRDLIK